jgi:hypothetical protein
LENRTSGCRGGDSAARGGAYPGGEHEGSRPYAGNYTRTSGKAKLLPEIKPELPFGEGEMESVLNYDGDDYRMDYDFVLTPIKVHHFILEIIVQN